MITKYPALEEQAMCFTFSILNERQRRLFAAIEALKLGHGSVAYVAELFGCHRRTVERGLRELRLAAPSSVPAQQRARKKGGGGSPA